MIDVEAEVNKYKGCKDLGKLEAAIQEYKGLAFKYAGNLTLAGRYNKVVLKLQEIYNKLPNPLTKKPTAKTQSVPLKTASITNEENAQISAKWKKKTGAS